MNSPGRGTAQGKIVKIEERKLLSRALDWKVLAIGPTALS